MSDIHRPEQKEAITIRFPASQMRRLRARARAEDRSLSSLVTAIVRAELDNMDAREMAE